MQPLAITCDLRISNMNNIFVLLAECIVLLFTQTTCNRIWLHKRLTINNVKRGEKHPFIYACSFKHDIGIPFTLKKKAGIHFSHINFQIFQIYNLVLQ